MSSPDSPVRVAAFYRFAQVADPRALAARLREMGAAQGLVRSITHGDAQLCES